MPQAKILIADDDEISRALLKEILFDYTNIYEVSDGAEAIAFLQRNPDTRLVLLDIQMPKLSGFSVLAHMRISPYLCNMPVLILSSSVDEDTVMTALKLGATEFATKPYKSHFLRRRIANLLQLPINQSNHSVDDFAHQIYLLSQTSTCGFCVYEMCPDYSIKTIYFSDSFAELCGYQPKEYRSFVKNGSDLERILSLDERTIFSQAVETLSTDYQPVYQTLNFTKKDGSICHLSLNLKLYGKIMGSLIFHSVTINLDNPPMINDALSRIFLGSGSFDMLTRIYNRETFCTETQKLLDEHPNQEYILVLMNVDRFKIVNDLFGTQVGDSILIKIATYLKRHFFGFGTFGRLEADTFAFCLPAEKFELERMLKEQTALCSSIGIQYNLSIRNGIYHILNDESPVSSMIECAQITLNSIKDNYVLRYAYYDEKIRQTMLIEKQILSDMHRALTEGEFLIYLQPIYSLTFNKPICAEVLVRWQHPRLGLITPAQFIPLFEKNHFISEIDRHIWELAANYLASRKEKELPIIPLSVNVSRTNFFASDLPRVLMSIIKKYNLSPSMLRLEMTESGYIENPLQLISATRRLQKLGFKVILDDFGSGYSSLKMLKDMPFDTLKLDMRSLDDLENSPRTTAVLLGTIKIAQNLNMSTIAEGIETKFQLELLRTAGCDDIQGYYYAKPMTTDEFDLFMENPPVI